MFVKIKPSLAVQNSPCSDGFVVGNPGLNHLPVSVCGIVQISYPAKGKKPVIEDLKVHFDGVLRYPADMNRPEVKVIDQSVSLMSGNKYDLPGLHKAAVSGASQDGKSKTIDIPFNFPISAEQLRSLPPTIQLSEIGPILGSQAGLKYQIKVVCKYTTDLAIPQNLGGFYDASAGGLQTTVKECKDTRTIFWPHFKESHVLDVVKGDILNEWGYLQEKGGMYSSHGDRSVSADGSSNASASAGSQVAVDEIRNLGNGNPVRRMGRTMTDGLSTTTGGYSFEVVGRGGWQGAVEFEADTICFGDVRQIKYKVIEPEYFGLNDGFSPPSVCSSPKSGPLLRRGTAHFEVVLIESWSWVGKKVGVREIALLEVSEATLEEFAEEQLAYIKFPDFLLPSIRIPHIEVSHRLVFRFRLPFSVFSYESRVPQFDTTGNILRNHDARSDFIPKPVISAFKSLAGKDSFQDHQTVTLSAPIRVCAFNRNDLDILFSELAHIPPKFISYIPPSFIAKCKLKSQSQVGPHSSSHSSGRGVVGSIRRLSLVSAATNNFLSRRGSTKSKSSSDSTSSSPPKPFQSMQSVPQQSQPASIPQPPSLQQTRTHSSPHLASSKNTLMLVPPIPPSLMFSANSITTPHPPPSPTTPTTTATTATTSFHSQLPPEIPITGNFHIIPSSHIHKKPSPGSLLPPPPPPSLSRKPSDDMGSSLRMTKTLHSKASVEMKKLVRSTTSATTGSTSSSGLSSTRLVSTMDKELCQNLSKSGFL
ncbi:hypothetical protein BDR26DRAFT_451807 [Obelidium mucronatum]|nr:hypothetical protein BDR26DRAFT_451807 [Obelidium mucronatum]